MAHEITEKDGMFSVLETPWHGLGQILDKPPTIEEAIVLANLNWSVNPMPLFTENGIAAPAQGLMREDTGDILGVVGTRYEVLQNDEAFAVFQPLVDSGDIVLETAGSLKEGRRVWILAKMACDSQDIDKGDEIRPYVLLSNSHDGKQAVRLGFTPVRVVCNNTLTAAEGGRTSQLIKVAHLSNVRDALLELTNIMDLQKATFEATIEQYRALAAYPVSAADLRAYVRLALGSRQVLTTVEDVDIEEVAEDDLKKTEQTVIRLFEEGRSSQGTGENMWRAYNAVNEFLAYERGKDTQDARLYSLWFAEAGRIDRRAMDAALYMAKAA